MMGCGERLGSVGMSVGECGWVGRVGWSGLWSSGAAVPLTFFVAARRMTMKLLVILAVLHNVLAWDTDKAGWPQYKSELATHASVALRHARKPRRRLRHRPAPALFVHLGQLARADAWPLRGAGVGEAVERAHESVWCLVQHARAPLRRNLAELLPPSPPRPWHEAEEGELPRIKPTDGNGRHGSARTRHLYDPMSPGGTLGREGEAGV